MRSLLARGIRPTNVTRAINKVIDVPPLYRLDETEKRHAYSQHKIEKIRLLVLNRANPNEKPLGSNQSPLSHVIFTDKEVAIALIDLDADVNEDKCLDTVPSGTSKPLILQAVEGNNIDLVRAMLVCGA